MGWGYYFLDELEVDICKVNSNYSIFTSCQQKPIIFILFTFNALQTIYRSLSMCYCLKYLTLLLNLPQLNIPILPTRHHILIIIRLKIIKLLWTFLKIDFYEIINSAFVCSNREMEFPVISVHYDD